ncbi:MAG: hypothetical protein FIB01_11515 [Gemmatimonadetes bacterium]|nr:hypothetical protein [Gemmatimonadota bacterium]
MTGIVLCIGTKRGLFLARSEDRAAWRLSEPLLVGREIYHAWLDPRDPRRGWAASAHKVWGPHVHRTLDGGRTWDVLEAAPHFPDERGLGAIWHLAPGPGGDTLLAGIEPAGLFVSRDAGESWDEVQALNRHPTSSTWQPAGGALALGSIQYDPREPRRLYCSVSAGGVYCSEDEGATWQPRNRGVRADFLPQPFPEAGQCVHRLRLHPARPDRLYQQNLCGVYRSDDRGETWHDITDGLPSGFGYGLALDPGDADVAFVIPEESSHMRTTVGGRLRVYRTRDAGRSWEALERGLPQQHAYVSVLREGMCHDPLRPAGVYFGTSSGHLFASADAGETWQLVAGYLPRILSVTASAW